MKLFGAALLAAGAAQAAGWRAGCTHSGLRTRPAASRAACRAALAAGEPPEAEDEEQLDLLEPLQLWPGDDERAALAARIATVAENEALRRRVEALPMAMVLVFEAETESEAVYSMEVEGAHVVLAFEDRHDAERYALTLIDEPPYHGAATVQALDVEALVVTSRDADFRVGLVFGGEVREGDEGALITSSAAGRLAVGITMVPETLFEGRRSEDYLDPAEDPVWVLTFDEGTPDAQHFTSAVNGSVSVVCFRSEGAAARCAAALTSQGAPTPATRARTLGELIDGLDDAAIEVVLVEDVVETVGGVGEAEADGEGEGGGGTEATSVMLFEAGADGGADNEPAGWGGWELPAELQPGGDIAPAAVRTMLARIFDGSEIGEGGAGGGAPSGGADGA